MHLFVPPVNLNIVCRGGIPMFFSINGHRLNNAQARLALLRLAPLVAPTLDMQNYGDFANGDNRYIVPFFMNDT